MCISRFLTEKIYSTERGNMGLNHTVRFSKGEHGTKFGKERVHREELFKSEPHEPSPCASKFAERTPGETLHQERCARGVAYLARSVCKLKNADKATFSFSCWSTVNAGTHFEKTRRTRVRSRFRCINAHVGQKRIKLRRTGDSAKTQGPHSGGILISSCQCNFPKKCLQSYQRENCAKPQIFLWVGQRSKNHGWPKRGRVLFAIRTISYFLLFPGCPPILVAIRLQHRHCRSCRH